MKEIVLLISGPDAEKLLMDMIANCEYLKLAVAVWIADNPKEIKGDFSLSYAPLDEEKEMIKH